MLLGQCLDLSSLDPVMQSKLKITFKSSKRFSIASKKFRKELILRWKSESNLVLIDV